MEVLPNAGKWKSCQMQANGSPVKCRQMEVLSKCRQMEVLSKCRQMDITIHHGRPCRIEISHPRGRKFNQGRGLPSPWFNSDPEGEISLSYMDRLMMDRFSPPLFEGFFSEHKNSVKT